VHKDRDRAFHLVPDKTDDGSRSPIWKLVTDTPVAVAVGDELGVYVNVIVGLGVKVFVGVNVKVAVEVLVGKCGLTSFCY
jgi:hypothetical protein